MVIHSSNISLSMDYDNTFLDVIPHSFANKIIMCNHLVELYVVNVNKLISNVTKNN